MKVNGKTSVETIAGDYDWITCVGHGNELGLANGFYVSQLKYPYAVKARVFHFASCSPLYNYDYAHSIALNTVLRKFGFTIEEYNKSKNIVKSRGLKSNHHRKDIYFKVLTEITNRSFYLAKDMYEEYSKVFYNHMLINKDIKNAIIYDYIILFY